MMENETSNYEYENDEYENLSLSTIYILSCLGVIGVIGNLCVMYAILRHSHMRTAPNILIFNLAVADLLYILVPTLLQIEHEIDPSWDLPAAFCKLKYYVAYAAQYASVFALVALSRERHTAIVGGLEAHQRRSESCASSSKCVVAVVWLTSLVLPIPTLVFAHTHQTPYGPICRASSLTKAIRSTYELYRVIVGYIIPLLIVLIYYVNIAHSLLHSMQGFQNVGDALVKQIRVRKRLAVSVLVITIFFAVCWFPYILYFMLIHFGPDGTPLSYKHAKLVAPVINTCVDPWLLFLISSKHRACLVGCLTCCRRTKKEKSGHSMHSTVTSRSMSMSLKQGRMGGSKGHVSTPGPLPSEN